MSQNRSLDAAELAALVGEGKRGKRYKPRLCKNSNCNNTFLPKRADQVFCSQRCRLTAAHARNVKAAEELTGRTCLWCGKELPVEMKASARYCSDKHRALAFKSKPCVYCGNIADTRDHFIPRAFLKRIEDLGWANKDNIIVPACRECNSTAGAKVFNTLNQKRNYIHERYKVKYKKVLEMPKWEEHELEEFGHSLRVRIKQSMLAKEEIKARLRWPRVIE